MAQPLKIVLEQMNPTVGAIHANARSVADAVRIAAKQKADLVVFPELVLAGYPPEDLVLKPAFIDEVAEALDHLLEATRELAPAALVGAPYRYGKHLYNVLFLIGQGKVLARVRKHHLPNYGVFDEKRVFKEAGFPKPVVFKGYKLGIMVCEDMWFPDVSEHLKKQGAEILVAPHASPFEDTKRDVRFQHARSRVKETGLPLVFVNQVGGQDELVFDGSSFALDAKGRVQTQLPAFAEAADALTISKKNRKVSLNGGKKLSLPEGEEQLYSALMYGLREYVEKNGFASVIIGLSGGIDSALTAALAVDALGSKRVHTLMMPSPYTSRESLKGAKECASLLGIEYAIIPITEQMKAFARALAGHFRGLPPDTTEENIQARIRAILLMALSNKFGHMVLATGNKSEMSIGYSTLYGDLSGGFAVLKDLYKTKVYALAKWRNGRRPKDALGPKGRVIPKIIFERTPSAELKPDQSDQDTLPPYEVLDPILHAFIEEDASIDEVVAKGFDPEVAARVERMIYVAEYKRRQAPPGVKITARLFGRDRRYPITNAFRDQPGTPKRKS